MSIEEILQGKMITLTTQKKNLFDTTYNILQMHIKSQIKSYERDS